MIFFLTLAVRGLFHREDFRWENTEGGTGLLSQKTEALYGEPNERVEAVTGSYSAAGDFLQHIYSMLVVKNHQKIWSGCLVREFSYVDIF